MRPIRGPTSAPIWMRSIAARRSTSRGSPWRIPSIWTRATPPELGGPMPITSRPAKRPMTGARHTAR